jgi:heat shock protein HslJ
VTGRKRTADCHTLSRRRTLPKTEDRLTPPSRRSSHEASVATESENRMSMLNQLVRSGSAGLSSAVHRLLWLPLLTLSLAACATSGASGSPPLRGSAWMWVPLTGELPAPAAAGGRAPQLLLAADAPRVSGQTGCNRLSGGFELEGNALRFTQTVTTRMACVEGMEREQQFLDAMSAVRGWRIEDRVLTLTSADGAPVMRLQAAAP